MRIVRSFQNRADTHIFYIFIRRGKHAVKFRNQRFVARFFDQIDHFFRIGQSRFAFIVRGDLILNMRDFSADFRGTFEVLPDFRLFLLGFQFFELFLLIIEVERVPRFRKHAAHSLNF